jgi:23S rRNA (cytosine1962-C5)-methyltransferase
MKDPVHPSVFASPAFADHALIDSGGQEKLERFGELVLRRPDPQALWKQRLPADVWNAADLTFVRESDRGGRFEARAGAHPAALAREPVWSVRFESGVFRLRPTPFKHVGLFPEQAANWELVSRRAKAFGVERPRLLNLFAYTGAASVLAAQAGFEVTHVEASKSAIAWTRENVELSGLPHNALRIVLEDAPSYAKREMRRGARFHVILLDPPHYGRGPKNEKWQFEDDILELVTTVRELLAERALVVLSTYAIGTSPLALAHLLAELGAGALESGELALREDDGARALPAGFCARWSRGVEP